MSCRRRDSRDIHEVLASQYQRRHLYWFNADCGLRCLCRRYCQGLAGRVTTTFQAKLIQQKLLLEFDLLVQVIRFINESVELRDCCLTFLRLPRNGQVKGSTPGACLGTQPQRSELLMHVARPLQVSHNVKLG